MPMLFQFDSVRKPLTKLPASVKFITFALAVAFSMPQSVSVVESKARSKRGVGSGEGSDPTIVATPARPSPAHSNDAALNAAMSSAPDLRFEPHRIPTPGLYAPRVNSPTLAAVGDDKPTFSSRCHRPGEFPLGLSRIP